MKSLLTIALSVVAVASMPASTTFYQYFIHEGFPDRPSQDAAWNVYYSDDADLAPFVATRVAPPGPDIDAFSAISEGTGGNNGLYPSAQDAGFLFFSGTGDASTGFAPQAFHANTTRLTTTNRSQAEGIRSTPEPNWWTQSATWNLANIPFANLREIGMTLNPRNTNLFFNATVNVDGVWYVTADAILSPPDFIGIAWGEAEWDVQSSDWKVLAFEPGVTLDIDLSDDPIISSSEISGQVKGFGLYVDTDDYAGTGSPQSESSWVRVGAYRVEAVPEPSVMGLFGLGAVVGLLMLRRRR